MALHAPSGRWRLGLLLALITAGFWATLPVALKLTLAQLDPYTLTWARFAFAAIAVGAWLAWRGEWGRFAKLGRRGWLLLAIAAVMLVGNYVLYLLGLAATTPANAQLLIQAAPLLMALGGIFVFRERFNAWQWLGLAAIAAGLLLFFGDQFATQVTPQGHYVLGSVFVLLGALAWAIYALAQKQLLNALSSGAILGFIYLFATFALWPIAHPSALLRLDALHLGALVYCAINTLGAYGAFAEALAHWEASRVSVVLSLTPLLTVATIEVVHAVAPALAQPERIAALGWIGAALVVAGSVVSSLMKSRAQGTGPEAQ